MLLTSNTRADRRPEMAAPRHIALALALLLVGAGVAAAVFGVPQLTGLRTLIVIGGSMGGSAPAGSIVIARRVPAADVSVGDVIVVNSGSSRPKLHRVIAINTAGGQRVAFTQGDANRSPDPGTSPLAGQVMESVATLPYAGYLVVGLTVPIVWLAILAAGVLCGVVVLARRLRNPEAR